LEVRIEVRQSTLAGKIGTGVFVRQTRHPRASPAKNTAQTYGGQNQQPEKPYTYRKPSTSYPIEHDR
jgi:hypothetical protein